MSTLLKIVTKLRLRISIDNSMKPKLFSFLQYFEDNT